MLLAFAVAVLAVLLGAGISFLPALAHGLLGYLRTFATLSAVAVVVTHLLPEAVHDLGFWSFALFLAGWFAPALAHRIGRRRAQTQTASAVLEAGYFGLVIHHVADGIGLGTYTRLPAERGPHWDVIIALAAHTIPLIAVVALAYRSMFGARSAVLRSLGLAFASGVGIVLSNLLSARTLLGFAPAISAVAAGLLLHVVTHDVDEDVPSSPLGRLLDLVVAALGIAVSLIGAWKSLDPGPRLFCLEAIDLAEQASLVILVALAVAAFAPGVPGQGSKLLRSVQPAGALGGDSVLLSVAAFGYLGAGLRLLCLAATISLLAPSPGAEAEGSTAARPGVSPRPPREPIVPRRRIVDTLQGSGPWLVLGLLLGALLRSLPLSLLSRRPSELVSLLLVALVGNLTPVAAPAAVLIASALSTLGFSAGTVLLVATLPPLLALLGGHLKARALATVICVAGAGLCDAFRLSVAPLHGTSSSGELGYHAAIALAAVLIIGVRQRGARSWLSAIVSPSAYAHAHLPDVRGRHAN